MHGKPYAHREFFVEKWARFVNEHPATEWSKMQKEFIDSQIDNAKRMGLTKEQVKHLQKKS